MEATQSLLYEIEVFGFHWLVASTGFNSGAISSFLVEQVELPEQRKVKIVGSDGDRVPWAGMNEGARPDLQESERGLSKGEPIDQNELS